MQYKLRVLHRRAIFIPSRVNRSYPMSCACSCRSETERTQRSSFILHMLVEEEEKKENKYDYLIKSNP
jgi:hypothetical protein